MRTINHVRIFAFAALIIVAAHNAYAGDFRLVINGKSHHINASRDWNEENVGLGLEYELDSKTRWKKLFMANGFRDSDAAMSYMAGAGIYRRLFESNVNATLYMDAGLTAFLMTREDYNDSEIFPGILPSLRFGYRNAGINLAYMPKKAVERFLNTDIKDPTLDGVLFLQLTINLDRER